MEELDFFDEICLTSLYATKAVKFAAVVDSTGKMVTGKIRRRLLILSYLFDSRSKQ
jgi:hypothetical protein